MMFGVGSRMTPAIKGGWGVLEDFFWLGRNPPQKVFWEDELLTNIGTQIS